jgi:tetratricopeptide (TPR) repeat protein
MARRLAFLMVTLAGLLTHAAPDARATALAKDAERLYKDGQYKEAAKLLEEAQALEPNPKFLYNMARAYDQAGELQPALDTYGKYIGLPATDSEPDLVKKANLSMDRLRQLLARQEADSRVRDAEKTRLEKEANDARERAEAEAEKSRRLKAQLEAKEKAQSETAQTEDGGLRDRWRQHRRLRARAQLRAAVQRVQTGVSNRHHHRRQAGPAVGDAHPGRRRRHLAARRRRLCRDSHHPVPEG